MPSEVLPEHWLFNDQIPNDLGAMFAILLGAMIAAGGGLGGGGVFVPIYILILGYPPKFAAALSQATIFGGSIVNLMMNLKKYHPTRKHRPLTDFSTLLIFEPMLLVGTIIGVLLNVIFPDILILILLALVLSYATVRTTRKGIRLWKKESTELKQTKQRCHTQSEISIEVRTPRPSTADQTDAAQNTNDNTNDNTQQQNAEPITPVTTDANTATASPNTATAANEAAKDKFEDVNIDTNPDIAKENTADKTVDTDKAKDKSMELIQELADGCGCDPKQISSDKIEICQTFIDKESETGKPFGIILIVWLFVSGFAILRKEEFTGIAKCDLMYWFVTFLPLPIMMGVSYLMTMNEYQYYQTKLNSDCWIPAFGDIKLEGNFVKILKYPAIATIAGILGGLLGIGGGMIVSPLLIELGVIPTVAAATSAMAVLITSSSAMLQFLLLGFLQFDYTLFFMAVGIVGTYVGQTAVNHAVKKYGRVSVVIFAVATVMALAIVLMSVNGFLSLLDGVSWAFSTPC